MRSSPAAIAVRLVQGLGGMLAVTLLWWTAGRRLDGVLGLLVDVAFWTYVVLRPLSAPLAWATTTWRVDDDGVRVSQGWLFREHTAVGWDEVASVDVSQPSLHRLFRCFTIRLGLGTTQKPALRIDAVTAEVRDRIVALAHRAQVDVDRRPECPEVRAAQADPRGPSEIYRIRPLDYLLVSVTYGQFVLFVPAALSLVDQVQDWVALPLPDPAVVLHWSPLRQLGVLLGLAVVSIGYGWVFAWLRFRGFQVVRDEDRYVTRGGLLSSETRSVEVRHINGLRVTQNPLMRATGFGRVSVLTTDAGDQPMANLLFPVVRLSRLPAMADSGLVVGTEVVSPTLRLGVLARSWLCLGGAASAAALLVLAYTVQPRWILASGSAVLLVVALVVNSRWVVATPVPGRQRCYARRGIFWVTHVELDASAIHVVQSTQGLLGRMSRTWSVAVHYHDGRVRSFRAPGCDEPLRRRLVEMVC